MEAARGSESPRRSRSRWLCLKGGCSVPRIHAFHAEAKHGARLQKARAADQRRVQRTGAATRSASEIYTEIRELDGVKGPPQMVMSPSTLWALAASTCRTTPISTPISTPTAVSDQKQQTQQMQTKGRGSPGPTRPVAAHLHILGFLFILFSFFFASFLRFFFGFFSLLPFCSKSPPLTISTKSIENIYVACVAVRGLWVSASASCMDGVDEQAEGATEKEEPLLDPSPGRFFGSEAEPDDADEPFGNMVREGLQYGEQGRSGEAGEQIVANQTLRAKFDCKAVIHSSFQLVLMGRTSASRRVCNNVEASETWRADLS
ncbi:hypothetical protein TRV_05352 [Trichophyton verrucosum HKI 0517]|uniref:Uncharacterized protein n=1 Tax=Trichophyton verrucosum (strain HKI 0517) TaxID=663202 RepID=D4DDY8_TRIVH|nr:uncharacterized protein TRV_05352 [Trichophyton verrucosum HKI 0517]EFE39935.1 hypothetical protein TRV_05352 [Trichophyton verrucosum HKI 0517]